MTDRKTALFGFLLVLACCIAQPGWSAVADKTPVWRVSGASNQVFLLGSIHMLREQDYPLPAAIETAYLESESIIMEIDLDDLDPLAAQAIMRQLGVLPADQSLRQLMGPELYPGVEQAATVLDIPLELLQQSRPWLAAVTIEQLLLSRIGFNPALGIEAHLVSRAASDGKEITGLETLREQFEFLASLTLDTQRQLLLQTLDSNHDLEQQMDALIHAWRHGDVAFIEAQMLEDIVRYPELYAVIVSERNRRWAEQIEQLLDDEQDYLVVMGSMHLVGADGVPALLQQKDLQVLQLTGELRDDR